MNQYFPSVIPRTKFHYYSERQKEFSGYGSHGAFNIKTTDEGDCQFVFQREQRSERFRLVASQPALPLGLPNNTFVEESCPLLGDLQQSKKTFSDTIFQITKAIGFHKTNAERRSLLNRYRDILRNHDPETFNKSRDIDPEAIFPKRLERFVRGSSRDVFLKDPYTPSVNYKYTGGSLGRSAIFSGNELHNVLFHPSGANMDVLTCTEMEVLPCGSTMTPNPTGTINLNSGKICEISTASNTKHYDDNCVIAIRTEQTAMLLKYQQAKADNPFVVLHEKQCKEATSIALSPYIDTEYLVATGTGAVELWSLDRMEMVCDASSPRFQCKDEWTQTNFGSHPRCITLADRTGLGYIDTRIRGKREIQDIFSLPHKCLDTKERLMCSAPYTPGSFYHVVATDQRLFLLDERFPNHPVLQWKHMLLKPPQYIDVTTSGLPDSSDDIIIVSSQECGEMMCFQCNTSSNDLDLFNMMSEPDVYHSTPRSTCTQWRASQISDFPKASSLMGVTEENRKMLDLRLGVAIQGICAINLKEGHGFTAIQMSAYGDLFYQAFTPVMDQRLDKTCSSGPCGSEGLNLNEENRMQCAQWVQHCKTLVRNQPQLGHPCDVTSNFSAISTIRYPHLLCALCRGDMPAVECNPADFCEACGFSLSKGRQLKKSAQQGAVIHASSSDIQPGFPSIIHRLPPVNPRHNDRAMSKLMICLWTEDEDVGDIVIQLDKERKERKLQEDKEETQSVLNESISSSILEDIEEMSVQDSSSYDQPQMESILENNDIPQNNFEMVSTADDINNFDIPSRHESFTQLEMPSQQPGLTYSNIRKDIEKRRHVSTPSQRSRYSNKSRSSMSGFGETPERVRKFLQSPRKPSLFSFIDNTADQSQKKPSLFSFLESPGEAIGSEEKHDKTFNNTQGPPVRRILASPSKGKSPLKKKRKSLMGFF
ncbi:unnamed protein product [Owenia fusiformis]|uniref:TAF1C beta-propeller domain-containing protein n=1 Tax=Owenia fusiformis TaxID=6347 RepID=A0A8J1XU71_OWEFU|nr:unnamed protein product [Owenia fusiformis]